MLGATGLHRARSPKTAGHALIVLGLSVFLHGTDIGIVPVGHEIGSRLVRIRRFPLILLIGSGIAYCTPVEHHLVLGK